ncbi:MAG: RNA 2'-phosphotransferase [Chloroflexi bacterium]|nr:RNA 2'-phosphotransferase [Chloroflexota bacterium]
MDYKRLSKTIAVALRHNPEKFGLTLDTEGWTLVDDLLSALRRRNREWRDLTGTDLLKMIEQSTKQRYELRDGKIRAFYGHSLDEKIEKTPAEPPEMLYHGTSPAAAAVILAEGLKPMSRQYVHLSTDLQTAQMVGSRHAASPVVLIVQALAAYQAGVQFYLGNEDIWLADDIPPQFIKAS